MSNKINEFRRVVLALCFFGLIMSLIGRELPWVKLTQSKPQTPLYITTSSTCNATNGVIPAVHELQFTVDVFMTLSSAVLCQDYISGKLPPSIGGANLEDVYLCTDIKFKEVSNFMEDASEWDDFSKKCGSSGGGTFFFIISALIAMSGTMVINTFPVLVKSCCPDQYSKGARMVRSLLASVGPICVTLGLMVYSGGCVHSDRLGDVLSTRNFEMSGSGGYYLCCLCCALLWFYWALFLLRMCNNDPVDVQAFVKGRKHRKQTDVDVGMMEESQEQRETVMNASKGGAYNDNAVYRDHYEEVEEDTRKGTISAYDDDGIQGLHGGGIGGHAPSAGSWRDVEED